MKRLLCSLCVLVCIGRTAAAQTETVEYYAQDAVGSIRIVFTVDGTVAGRQDYAPFGRPLLTVTTMPKEGFGAQEEDDESNQLYFHVRFMHSAAGRFRQPDPIGGRADWPQSWNRYSYAANAPLVLTDYSGLVPTPGVSTSTALGALTRMMLDRPKTNPLEVMETYVWTDGIGAGGRSKNQGAKPEVVMRPRRDNTPIITPDNQDLPLSPLVSDDGWTVTLGVGGTVTGGFGVTGSAGFIGGNTGCPGGGLAGGGFASGGFATGAEASVGVELAVLRQNVAQAHGVDGELNVGFHFGAIGISVNLGNGGFLGTGVTGATFTYGPGIGASASVNKTGVAVVGKDMTWDGTCK